MFVSFPSLLLFLFPWLLYKVTIPRDYNFERCFSLTLIWVINQHWILKQHTAGTPNLTT